MITYYQLNTRLTNNNINQINCYNILSDFGELLLNSAELIKITKESKSYELVCKLINSILIDFLIDKNNLISNNNSLLTNILNSNILDDNRRGYFFNLLKNAMKLMEHTIMVSENDESLTNKAFDDFNNYYSSFQDVYIDFKKI